MENIPKSRIRAILQTHYNSSLTCERSLKIMEGENCTFYYLQGSPPKGYAIKNGQELWLYDAWGKRFKIYTNVL